jgi:hypothetical protein
MTSLPDPFVMDLDRPVCLCGKQMRLALVEPMAFNDHTEFRTFDCKHCSHELRIMHVLDDGASPST